MAKKTFKPIRLFKPGTHTASNGKTITFTTQDVREIAESYSEDVHSAPIVIGHPETDDPAMGWIGSTAFDEQDSHLYATPRTVVPEFAELNEQGSYERVSASLYDPENPSNPVQGKWYLKHVGFLGAQQPAVKGLGNYKFSEEDGALEFSFSAAASNSKNKKTIAQFASGMTELFMNFFGKNSELNEVVIDAEATPTPDTTNEFEEHEMKPEEQALAYQKAKLATEKKAHDKKVAAFNESEKQRTRDECLAYAEGLVEDGKLFPREKEATADFLAGLDNSQELSFAEGEDTQSPTEFVKTLLGRLPVFVDFSERTKGKKPKAKSVTYRAPDGEEVDEAGLDHLARIKEYERDHKVSFAEASVAVPREV